MEFNAIRRVTKVLWSHRPGAYILRPAHAGPRVQKAVVNRLPVYGLRTAIGRRRNTVSLFEVGSCRLTPIVCLHT